MTLSRLRQIKAALFRRPPVELVESEDAKLANELFDSRWYVFKYVDIANEAAALDHYLEHGWQEGRWPHPLFDPNYYLSQIPEDQRATANPLLHYLRSREDFSPHLLFEQRWYRRHYMSGADGDLRPLIHFFLAGAAWKNDPTPLFDTRWYAARYPDIAAAGWPPVCHYLHFGWRAGASPNAVFDARWYVDKYLPESDNNTDPLSHYLLQGSAAGYLPSVSFDPSIYLDLNPDVQQAGAEALRHYVEYGKKERRRTRYAREHFQDWEELKSAVRSVGASYRPHGITVQLPLRITNAESAYEVVYRSPRQTAEGIDELVPYLRNPVVSRLCQCLAIAGSRYVVDREGLVLNEEERYFFGDDNVAVKWNHARRKNGKINIDAHMRAGMFIKAGINLMHEHSENYFHFIAETLPRMVLAEEANLPRDIPYVFERGLHDNLIQLIHLMNVDQRPIVWLDPGCVCYFEEMYYPGNVSCVPNALGGGTAATKTSLDVERIGIATRRCKAALEVPAASGRKTYISRHGRIRNVVNQGDLQAVLSRHGFQIRSVECASLRTQIEIFSSASLIVSPTGAQLTNIVWCEPGTVLNYLVAKHPSMQLHLWGLLGRVSGTTVVWTEGPQTGRITGELSVHDDFTVDKEVLLQSLEPYELTEKQ